MKCNLRSEICNLRFFQFCLLPFGFCLVVLGCSSASTPPPSQAGPRALLLITIDTLRADHVGSYGYRNAHTPTLDAIARDGLRYQNAFAAAPITLTSHASLMTGRYPPGHGARHNGIAVNPTVPTLATTLKAAGFTTAAFVSAFPLDKRFGLNRGFDVYDDELPRSSDGRPLNERPGSETVSRAAAWLQGHRDQRFFLWVHLFDPHAPYGDPTSGKTAIQRYDEEITAADREAGRLIAALGPAAPLTIIVATADHGEAFGEHGELGHSLFVYDTTLHVPLMMKGPGIAAGQTSNDSVSLIDVAPTMLSKLDLAAMDSDGQVLTSPTSPTRPIYAETFAPLFDFGWAGLRSVRTGNWKYIAAPKPELYDLSADASESTNHVGDDPQRAAQLDAQVAKWSGPEPGTAKVSSPEVIARLQSLGYLHGSGISAGRVRPDPKDRVALSARLSSVMAGEVQGEALISTLEAILKDDPENPQAHLRLGYAELDRDQCAKAEPHFRAAITGHIPTADAGLGLAQCRGKAGDLKGAAEALAAAKSAEPESPLVSANIGLLALEQGNVPTAIAELKEALNRDPSLLQARFALARALARSGDRDGARAEAERLLAALPANAPQRPEVERLLAALK